MARLTAKEWRDRAKESRLLANGLHDPVSKQEMLRIAEAYERLAAKAEASEKTDKGSECD